MAKFFKLKVAQVKRETADCVSILFDLPGEVKANFQYTHGQHLTLKKSIKGEDVLRSYSICTSPVEKGLKVAVKQVEGGQFSTWANQSLTEGDEIEVMPPTGNFSTALNPDNSKTYLLVAAGSGITPIISIAKSVLSVEPKSRIILLYGNRKTESIIFHEELEALKNDNMDRFSIYHFLSQEVVDSDLLHGRIDDNKILGTKKLIDYSTIDEIFICGPEEMMAQSSEAFLSLGVQKERIHMELFTSPVGKLGGSEKKKEIQVTKGSEVSIILDGLQIDFSADDDSSILDMANAKGADLPFSCKGGVCSTCKAKVMEGSVEMDINYALEPEEIEAGYVLTCQSHPTSKKVVISFDQ